ncbi:MAG TPA: hypothetical protein EYO51_01475 [Methylococcaceae bacterium]|nr:hypothetical protein [Methylococcaceae bacterium]HIA46139.1 hypothetical protein [Methylococcaceae bacterium]HIB61828.1 hypothetical protein [Methylococcaceae bacterium]HIN68947.1 hypothetical protein [Methylococcales bacterium]HIO43980.1 hypothetical protein [Methylococcales bacterium]
MRVNTVTGVVFGLLIVLSDPSHGQRAPYDESYRSEQLCNEICLILNNLQEKMESDKPNPQELEQLKKDLKQANTELKKMHTLVEVEENEYRTLKEELAKLELKHNSYVKDTDQHHKEMHTKSEADQNELQSLRDELAQTRKKLSNLQDACK